MTSAQEEEFKAGVEDIYAKGADASATCNLVVNKAIEMELGLPKNFILFNRGRAFLENQIRDTTKELNEWDPKVRALKCDKKDLWRTWLNLTPGQHEYRFIVNGQWQEDPRCDDRQENPYGSFNSMVQV